MADAIAVTVENFPRAETDRMFASLAERAGGANRWHHDREPGSIDDQRVIRQNRDTLYSLAVVDIRDGATLTLPDAGDRYMSVMVVNEDHYINRVFHSGGTYELTTSEFDTPWVLVASRILVDPSDPADVAAVNALQDGLEVDTSSTEDFSMPDYDKDSFDTVRDALLTLSRHLTKFAHGFGKRSEVDPVLHLIATANGWGGLPDEEARYATIEPNLPVGTYELTVGDVPVDAFWSISVYNKAGFFEKNDQGSYSINSVTAVKNDDGSTTIRFGNGNLPNTIPIMDGWNYAVRMYRPRKEILDGTWTFPPVSDSAG
ncbi:DUF1214 domain-containing protein [Agromyces sp. PvR057]|uniref:DUF1214 domain-containing protein n=1 Tax=Agromyces sp. PvR057 TaxID=3156403 RepID=UPI0033963B96